MLSSLSGRRLVWWCLGWFGAFGCSRERMTSIFNHGFVLALLVWVSMFIRVRVDQASEGHLVDALVPRGDEGRNKLR